MSFDFSFFQFFFLKKSSDFFFLKAKLNVYFLVHSMKVSQMQSLKSVAALNSKIFFLDKSEDVLENLNESIIRYCRKAIYFHETCLQ